MLKELGVKKHRAMLLEKNNAELLELPEKGVKDRLQLLFSLEFAYDEFMHKHNVGNITSRDMYTDLWPLMDLEKPLRPLCEFLKELGISNKVCYAAAMRTVACTHHSTCCGMISYISASVLAKACVAWSLSPRGVLHSSLRAVAVPTPAPGRPFDTRPTVVVSY